MPKSVSPRLLAVASGGGHWIQLRRVVDSLQNVEKVFVTTLDGLCDDPRQRAYVICDANRARKLRVIWSALQLAAILAYVRPHFVLTTGAAPGLLAIRLGKLMGAKTIWIDSIANGDELSLSGGMAGPYADLWLTQWEHLAKPEGPHYRGAVL